MSKTISLVLIMGLFSMFTKAQDVVEPVESIYDLSIKSIDGEDINLSAYKGKKLLLVNVASKCGFTKQYKDLQALHEKHGKDVVIIGFPCNQFGGQEPGSHEEIKAFCEKNYGVEFLITEKVDVKGGDQHAIFSWLTSKAKNGQSDNSIKWNFHKFLVDEQGRLISMYGSMTNPLDDKITSNF